MKYFRPFRIAAVFLMLIFAGHTIGAMILQKSLGPQSDVVFSLMKSVHFDFNGADSTWYGFWFGFGLTASLFLLFSAIVAWKLDAVSPEGWPAVSMIAWALVAVQACNVVLSCLYFFAGPAVLGAIATLFLSIGAFRKGQTSASVTGVRA